LAGSAICASAKIIPFVHGLSQDWNDAVVIKPEYSPINLLSKMFFNRQPLWEQRRKTVLLLWSILTGLIFGGLCMAVIFFQNNRH